MSLTLVTRVDRYRAVDNKFIETQDLEDVIVNMLAKHNKVSKLSVLMGLSRGQAFYSGFSYYKKHGS